MNLHYLWGMSGLVCGRRKRGRVMDHIMEETHLYTPLIPWAKTSYMSKPALNGVEMFNPPEGRGNGCNNTIYYSPSPKGKIKTRDSRFPICTQKQQVLLLPHENPLGLLWKSFMHSADNSHTFHTCHLFPNLDTGQRTFFGCRSMLDHRAKGFRNTPRGIPWPRRARSCCINPPPSSPLSRTALRYFYTVSQRTPNGSEPQLPTMVTGS